MAKKKPFQLTRKNYYAKDRPHLSNSQLSDYLFSPDFYKKKYIEKREEFEFEVTDPMKRGLLTDDLLTNNGKGNYQRKVKRTCLKRDNPELYDQETRLMEAQEQADDRYIVSPRIWDEAHTIADEVRKQPFWKKSKKQRAFQVLLETKYSDLPFCGLADWIETFTDKVLMVDLKITNQGDVKNPRIWLRKAKEFGYIRQLALYIDMHSKSSGRKLEDYKAINFCVWMTNKGYVKMAMFEYTSEQLEEGFADAMTAIRGIKRGDFEAQTWEYSKAIDMGLWE